MTLVTDLNAVGVTLDKAHADIDALASLVASELAARDTQIAQLQAQLNVPPTPALSLTTSLATINGTTFGRITASWNVDAKHIGRDGNDAYNTGTWSTDIALAARSQVFEVLLSSTQYTITLTLPDNTTVQKVITTPTIIGGGGGGPTAMLLGAYEYNSSATASHFGGLVNHETKIIATYCDAQYGMPDIFGSGGLTAWLQGDSTRRVVLGVVPLSDNPGNFEAQSAADHMAVIAHGLVAAGIQAQVIIRYGFEMNGDWHNWGRQYAGNELGLRFAAMWRRVYAVVQAIYAFKWDWCFIFWNTGTGENPNGFYPGDAYVQYIGSDNYDAWCNGDPTARWSQLVDRLQNQLAFAVAHGKPPTQDEWAVWNTNSSQGGGDNPYYISHFLQFCKDNGYAWVNYFDTTDGGVNTTIDQNPNSLNAFRAFAW